MAELLHDCDHTRWWPLLRRSTAELIANTRGCAVIRASISPILRRQIVMLAQQGMTTAEIAKRVHRGQSTVAHIIAEELDHADRLWARLAVQLGPQVVKFVAQMETQCRRERREETKVA